MEIELKLLLPASANAQLRRHPLLAAHARGPARSSTLLAHYFDTPALTLAGAGAGLRVRSDEQGRWVQTMKAGGSVAGGLHQRHEWESAVRADRPELSRLRPRMAGHPHWLALLATPQLARQLQPLFTVAVTRESWQLEIDGNLIELVLDHGSISAGGRQEAVNEIELELKAGQPQALLRCALDLLGPLPLRLSNVNKAERGYALWLQTPPAVRKASAPQLVPDGSAGQALQAIVASCLAQVQGNEDGLTMGADPESVHQMRVGLRRLRSALKLFEASAPCPAPLLAEIGWLGGLLGQARDWEVLAGDTLTQLAAATSPQQLDAIRQAAQALAQQQRQLAAEAVLSPRYTGLLLELGCWLLDLNAREQSGQKGGQKDEEQHEALAAPMRRFARHALRRCHARLLKRGHELHAGADARELHRLRIAAKQARYTLEFFAALYRPRRTRHFLAALAQLQETLGQHHDASVAAGLLLELERLQPELHTALGKARALLLQWQEQSVGGLRAQWKQLRASALPKATALRLT